MTEEAENAVTEDAPVTEEVAPEDADVRTGKFESPGSDEGPVEGAIRVLKKEQNKVEEAKRNLKAAISTARKDGTLTEKQDRDAERLLKKE